MFKLESYITPILLEYVSKYVKDIRQEDFQVSLWEGEVALHNLDLRLDKLQEELNLPVEFISGHIHDLSIRVPWTKITSEPITITINTIEFVLKLKNPREDGAGSSASSSPQRSSDSKKKRKCPPKTDDRSTNPEASSSWLVSKIINNISLQCHNIILKYVEEDIVVSMNVQLLSFGSANEKWESAMIDVHPVKVLIRKLVNVSDLTICLDKRNAAGQIDVCQEPILYRSSLECRILLKYNVNSPESNRITRIGVFTSLLDMNISSMQIPLCLRLVKLAMVFKEGKLNNKTTTPEALEDCVEEEYIEPVDQSYLSWVWNMLPSLNFAPEYEDEPSNETPCHTIDFGFYAEQLSFTLKNAEFVNDTHMAATKRIKYSPIVRLTIGGMFFELVSAEARNWMSAKAGVSSICLEPLGVFKTDSGNLIQTEESHNQRPFIDKSLFDEQCLIADKGWGVTNYDEYSTRITEDYLLYRSPVLAADFIKFKVADSSTKNNAGAANSNNNANNNTDCNRVQYRFLTGGITFRYTQTLEQVKQLISEFISSYDYPAYYTETLDGGGLYNAGNGSKLPPPLMEDYDALMQHIPLCTYKFSIQQLTIEVHAKTEIDIVGQKQQVPQQPLSQPFRLHGQNMKETVPPPHCVIYICRAEGTMTTPLQPDKLVHTTCQLPDKPSHLLDACYENYDLQVKEFSCSLVNSAEKRTACIVHIPNLSIKHGKLLQPHNWKDETLDIQKFNVNCEQFFFNFTRRELSSSYYLLQCAYKYHPIAFRRLIRQEAADLAIEDFSKLKNTFTGFQIFYKLTRQQNMWSITLNSLESTVVYKHHTEFLKHLLFSTTASKGQLETVKWLECNMILPIGENGKQPISKTAVAIWLASFSLKLDNNVLHFLRCRKFEEMERDTATESMIYTQILSIPNLHSNASVQSNSITTSIQQPPIVRRSSRNSLQRRISHPEETIHVSSERDEKLEKDTSTSASPHSPDLKVKNRPAWLSFIKSYILYIEVEPGIVHIAKNLENDPISTQILLPRVNLRPSSFDSTKIITLAHLQTAVMMSKEKGNINWTLTFTDFGIVSEIGTASEAFLEPIQTTITIALLYKNEKIKTNPNEIREEGEPLSHADKSSGHKDNKDHKDQMGQKSTTTTQSTRAISPVDTDYMSSASATVGARSEKSLPDNVASEGTFSTNWDIGKPFAKHNIRRPRKNRDIYTFNLHADTSPLRFLISSRKARTLEEHIGILMDVIKLLSIGQQTNKCIETSSEQISIITATEEHTSLREFLELETNSENSKYSDDKNSSSFVVLLFCQWTITRITIELEAIALNYQNSKIVVDLEDLLSTVDKREDFTKCTSKIGNLNVTYYEENLNGDWNLENGLTIRLLGDTSNLPFLNIIFTAVGLKNFFKRIGVKRKGDLDRNLNEVLIKMQALEIIVNLERLGKFVAAVSGFFERCSEFHENNVEIQKDNSNSVIAAHDLPMIHLDSKGFALYLPLEKGKDFCSVAIIRIQSIKITPNLENPLQRKPLRPDVFGKAAQLGMLGTPGSMIEDRQYELTLQNISAASGSWLEISKHMSEQRDNFFRTNPAFEWNNQNRKQDVNITDIFNRFTFIAIYAPNIVYQNVLISGQAIEFNCATDFVASLNMHQLNLLSCLVLHLQSLLCFINNSEKPVKRVSLLPKQNRMSKTSLKSSRNNPSGSNLNLAKSSMNVLQRCSSSTLNNFRDVRNSSIFNSIDEDTEHNLPTTDSGFQSCVSHITTTGGLKERISSVSTISSLPQGHQRFMPQTVSLVAGVFLFKFYDAQMSPKDDSEIYSEQLRITRLPLFSVTLSQPSFMYTQNVYDSTFQVSLYDFFINLAMMNRGKTSTHLVFNEIIVDTRPGKANTAGITPPLFSLRSHWTKMHLREYDIEFSKPIALLLTEDKVELLCHHILLINTTLLENPCFEVRPNRNLVRGSKIRLMRQQCLDADRLHIFFRSIVIRFQNESESYNCKLVSSDMKLNVKFLNRPEKATAKASIGALYLLVDHKAVIHPVNIRLSADFVNEPWHQLPLIIAIIKINMLQLDVGINTVLHLRAALNAYDRLSMELGLQWRRYLRNRPFEKEDPPINNRNLQLIKCPQTCGFSSESSKSSLQREEFYQDDLRAGAFQFVEMNTDTFLPMPYQIQIIKKNFGIICWRYPQPRKMSSIHVYPVPMGMTNPIHIRCRMEYYSEAHETFLHYCDFYLSETVLKKIQLPERKICANIWRVVILQSLISVNGACFDDMLCDESEIQKSIASIKIDDVLNSERKESDFILHPKVLVGCLRIDTTFESTCVPKIQLLLSCNFFTIKLLNQPNQGEELPSLLKKYKLVQTTEIGQAFLILSMQNMNVHAALVTMDNFAIESSVLFGIKCLDYGFLNMMPVLEETIIQSCVRVETKTDTLEKDISLNLVLDRMRVNMGPATMHSLLSSKLHWQEYLSETKTRHALVPRCIIVNRTYTFLTFGQTGTTERIQLQVREACLYSFRSDFHNQELTFFITDAESEMTEASQPVPISLKYNGEVLVQAVRVGKKCLFIKSRKLSPMQIYILIKGQIELMSMVPHDLYLDFRRESTTGTKKSKDYLISRKERACFYYSVDQKSNINMRLRLADNAVLPRSRSGDIPLRSNKNLPWLVKVPHPKHDFVSFWVRVFREDIKELTTDNFMPQKILITIWPIFELCSMMPMTIEAVEDTTSTNFKLLPQGKCQALSVPATHLTEHPVKLSFSHKISKHSANEFILTLKMLDWKEFFYYDEDSWDIEAVLSQLAKGNAPKWPFDDGEELRIERSIAEPQVPSVIFNCMPSRELSCTLRLEVSPWGYFINATSMVVCIRHGEKNDSFAVNSNELQMLFTIEKYFVLEISNATNWIASAPIYFEETAKNVSTGGKYYVISEKASVDIVILRNNQVLKFVLNLKIEQNRKILILRPKYILTNFTKRSLCVLPFAMDHKETATRDHVENLDAMVQKRVIQCVESRENCIGISLDNFFDLHAQKAKRTIDNAFVCFVCLKVCSESAISIPIPLSIPFTRRCFSAQIGSNSVAFAVTLIEHNGIYYLNIFNDPAPALLINNQTDMKFIIAQTNAAENNKVSNTTPDYMGRHFEWYQQVQPYSNCYYTPPEMYVNFPDVDSIVCNLTLALYKENLTKKDIKWSKPIRADKSWEKFLHIPNHGDVKIMICDKHRVIRVSIFYILQQKEFSVKDLRSRLSLTHPIAIDSDNSVDSMTMQSNSYIKTDKVDRCAHHPTGENESKFKTHFRIHAYAKEIVFTLFTDCKERDHFKTDVLSVYVDDFQLAYDDDERQGPHIRSLNFVLPNLQIDNQLHSTGKFDFPVIICAQELYERTTTMPQVHNLEYIYDDLCVRTPLVAIKLKFFDDEMSISDVSCSFSPLRAYIEDAYLNELFDALVECVPSNCVYMMTPPNKRIELAAGLSLLPRDIAAQAICIAEPLQLRSFRIEPLNVLLSVHTSVRLYIALDHSPLSFSTYQRQQILTVPLRFGQSLGMHYLSGAIFGAGWVVGSLEILGSPSGLARSFTTGLRDFVAMPVQGLFRGPWGFVVGITQGSASLLRNVTAGTVNSLTKLAASVARNLDRLTLDREHIERTEALRRVRPNSLTEGFSQGLTGLGISILGAVGGIAHHTLEARSPVEVVTGVGKGIVGALTKPISGAAELVALAGQGVLQTVGFNALPQQRMPGEVFKPMKEPSAYRIWKLLPSGLSTDQVLFYNEITLAVQKEMRSAYVFLTSNVFAILVAQWDKLEFAYPVEKVEIIRDREDKTLFFIRLVKEDTDELEDNLSYTNERIMNFLRSSHSMRDSIRFSLGSLQELLGQGISREEQDITHRRRDWAFYMDDQLGEHLMQYLKILRNEV